MLAKSSFFEPGLKKADLFRQYLVPGMSSRRRPGLDTCDEFSDPVCCVEIVHVVGLMISIHFVRFVPLHSFPSHTQLHILFENPQLFLNGSEPKRQSFINAILSLLRPLSGRESVGF
jgi:hypothetical protein